MAALTLNNTPLNRAALVWLRQAKVTPEPHYLDVLQLASWGLENQAAGEWPPMDRPALQSQVDGLFGWKPENAMAWLLSNPEGPARDEQETTLQASVLQATSAKEAAGIVLSAIYSRQQSQNPALQPAASELN